MASVRGENFVATANKRNLGFILSTSHKGLKALIILPLICWCLRKFRHYFKKNQNVIAKCEHTLYWYNTVTCTKRCWCCPILSQQWANPSPVGYNLWLEQEVFCDRSDTDINMIITPSCAVNLVKIPHVEIPRPYSDKSATPSDVPKGSNCLLENLLTCIATRCELCDYTSRHETLNQCWFHVGPPSTTLAQHEHNIGATTRVCWRVIISVSCLWWSSGFCTMGYACTKRIKWKSPTIWTWGSGQYSPPPHYFYYRMVTRWIRYNTATPDTGFKIRARQKHFWISKRAAPIWQIIGVINLYTEGNSRFRTGVGWGGGGGLWIWIVQNHSNLYVWHS